MTKTPIRDKPYTRAHIEKSVLKHFATLCLSEQQAQSIAKALLWAEERGISSHGLERIPAYTAQYKKKKINPKASLKLVSLDDSSIVVDANFGFAYPALDLAVREISRRCRRQSICFAAIKNSHHAGALGYYSQQLAQAGLISILGCNAPASIAPWGGKKALLGTNPIAFSCPRGKKNPPLIVDMSLSKVARGKIMAADFAATKIPEDWALDEQGKPTTDAAAALKGTMLPLGGAKGYLLALMIEILSGPLSDSNFSYESSSFFDDKGKPPGVGQFIIVINPLSFNPDFFRRIEELCMMILAQPGTRLPGTSKANGAKKINPSQRMIDYLNL